MWYLIGVVAVVLIGFFVMASVKKDKCCCCNTKDKDVNKPPFRTDECLEKYDKPVDGHHSTVDFDDAE